MPSDEFDVAVVGGGVMGASTAAVLGESGRRVVLFEQFEIGHHNGSSHGTSRIFRFSYRNPVFVRMAQEALPMWRRLERDTGEELVATTGGLDAGSGIEANVAALDECGAGWRMFDGREASRRWPQFRFAPDASILFQPDAGVIAADRAWRAFARVAQSAGVELRERTRVEALRPDGDAVEVVAGDRAVRAWCAVVTAGSWARPLLADAGIRLDVRPTRETVAYFALGGEPPPPLVEWGSPSAYALPAPGLGLKVGLHFAGATADPDAPRGPDEGAVRALVRWAAAHFPAADPDVSQAETCMYTNTPDEHFVLERHGPIVVGSPCSGHGFKFAPLIGRRLAALALDPPASPGSDPARVSRRSFL